MTKPGLVMLDHTAHHEKEHHKSPKTHEEVNVRLNLALLAYFATTLS